MAGGRRGASVLGLALVAASLFECMVVAAATTHTVGDSSGWTIPPNSSFYSDWAAAQSFAVGDTLAFNFQAGVHDVVQVPKSGYDSCSTSNQIGSTMTTSPATVTITGGDHYYICGFPGHCATGQKLAITVATSPSTTPGSPAPSSAASGGSPMPSATSPSSPVPGSGPASSALGVAAAFSILLSFASYFLL